MNTHKEKQRAPEYHPLEPGTIICLHPVLLDLEPVSAERLAAAQREEDADKRERDEQARREQAGTRDAAAGREGHGQS